MEQFPWKYAGPNKGSIAYRVESVAASVHCPNWACAPPLNEKEDADIRSHCIFMNGAAALSLNISNKTKVISYKFVHC